MEQQDVSLVMGEALFHLERITEHVSCALTLQCALATNPIVSFVKKTQTAQPMRLQRTQSPFSIPSTTR